MTIDTSTMLVVALLIFAASLASYFLGISPAFRHNRGLVIAGYSIGTALLLTAAVIVVVATNASSTLRLSTLRLSKGERSADENKLSSVDIAFPRVDREPTNETSAVSDAAVPTAAQRSPGIGKRSAPGSSQQLDRTAAGSATMSQPVRSPGRIIIDSGSRFASALLTGGPWSATQCVIAIQPDPAEPTRRWLENECGVPVAILFGACAQAAPVCNDASSTSWKYQPAAQLLPAKQQRSVTYAEQTQYGEHIRYAACAITSARAAELIGQERESHSSRAWLDELADEQTRDECLTNVRHWLDMGRRHGRSLDALLGHGVPRR